MKTSYEILRDRLAQQVAEAEERWEDIAQDVLHRPGRSEATSGHHPRWLREALQQVDSCPSECPVCGGRVEWFQAPARGNAFGYFFAVCSEYAHRVSDREMIQPGRWAEGHICFAVEVFARKHEILFPVAKINLTNCDGEDFPLAHPPNEYVDLPDGRRFHNNEFLS